MEYRRITLLCGHYGSGKTNIAVNMALDLARQRAGVVLADLDIVNPYFRSKDSMEVLKANNIRLICSEFANSNLDVPALPQEMYSVTDDRSLSAIVDVGGDDRGALALGRLSPAIAEEGDYDMLFVINKYRPLTPDAPSALEVLNEIEAASHLKFTGIVNCSNLGSATDASVVLDSVEFAHEVSRLTGLPVRATAVEKSLLHALEGKIDRIFPLTLQKRPVD